MEHEVGGSARGSQDTSYSVSFLDPGHLRTETGFPDPCNLLLVGHCCTKTSKYQQHFHFCENDNFIATCSKSPFEKLQVGWWNIHNMIWYVGRACQEVQWMLHSSTKLSSNIPLQIYIGIENPKEPLSNHFRIDHSQQFPWKLHSSTKLSPGIPGRYYELSQASWWWANLRLLNNFPGFINLSRAYFSRFHDVLKTPFWSEKEKYMPRK